MHRYGILWINQLADIVIHIPADTDSWSDVYIPHDKILISKALV